jgi:hypothetical protein
MVSRVDELIAAFSGLTRPEQAQVAKQILIQIRHAQLPAMADEELAELADGIFSLYDAHEKANGSA